MNLRVKRKEAVIYPDINRVFARFFFNSEERAEMLIKNILAMPDSQVDVLLMQTLREFSKRHRSITGIFKKHFQKVKYIVDRVNTGKNVSEIRKLLIGSYFTMEYAVESAALFNPSIVEDIDQSGLQKGEVRVILSLRATGEGHISSLVFRNAVIDADNNVIVQEPANHIGTAEVIKDKLYEKRRFISKLRDMEVSEELYNLVLKQLPDKFTYDQLFSVVNEVLKSNNLTMEKQKVMEEFLWLAESHTEVRFSLDTDLSERAIFPISQYEKNGIEDARFVKFTKDNGDFTYYGTYTAYDGYHILPKLIETKNFYSFRIMPLHGKYAVDKNLALFPRKINGKYVMVSRIDGINNYIMFSDNLQVWSHAEILQQPLYPWELVQIGNAGSPIETDRGWLLITHGVGPVRKYCLGACLLDLNDPTHVIGRTKEPLLVPAENERAGYVPNVVYSCGSYVHNGELIIPYAMSDYATAFASVDLNDLLDEIMS
ncbi:MAG TPA: glycoside hydrolase family 130 protein [Dysgonamonadaceae bacterium]|nr:glycoside hydrolase family 130 protein [Dysgonamonadaceae bacterium]